MSAIDMSAIDRCKGAAAVSAIAFGLFLPVASAHAEGKLATSNWNASSFGAACQKSPRCLGGAGPGNTYYGSIENDGTTTTVTCTGTQCVYDTRSNGGGGPARVKAPDKTLGTGVGLGGLLAGGVRAPSTPKLNVGQNLPRQVRGMDTPKLDVPRVKVEVPKIAAPASIQSVKDTKVNVIR